MGGVPQGEVEQRATQGDTVVDYDRWLEAPVQAAYEQWDMYVDWCEDNEFDPDDPAAVEAYDDWLLEQEG